MGGNSFGRALRMTTAGESHGPGLVVILDGCPAGLSLSVEDFASDMARRRPGQSRLTSPRQEDDEVQILSGVFEGQTTGSAIALLIPSRDARSKDYESLRGVFRPGHADYGYFAKYGLRDHRGGGRASARETAARVAAAVVAKKLLATVGAEVLGWVDAVGDVEARVDPAMIEAESVEQTPDGGPNPTRCPDPHAAVAMEALIEAVRADRDSVGGVGAVVARGLPPGLGEPVFDKLKADLGKGLLSLPAVVGVEYGSGFRAARMRGSVHNDAFRTDAEGRVRTESHNHGGMLGGLSTGEPLVVRAAVKPTSSIPQLQQTTTEDGEPTTVEVRGRHDPCLLPRFVPMAEAMVAWVLADHLLRQRLAQL